jgi:hypothetical protein
MTYTVFNFQRALAKEFDSPNHILNCCPPGTENTTAAQIASALAQLPIAGAGILSGPPGASSSNRKCILTRFRIHVNPKVPGASASRFQGHEPPFLELKRFKFHPPETH